MKKPTYLNCNETLNICSYLVGKIPLVDLEISGRGFLLGECSFLQNISFFFPYIKIKKSTGKSYKNFFVTNKNVLGALLVIQNTSNFIKYI